MLQYDFRLRWTTAKNTAKTNIAPLVLTARFLLWEDVRCGTPVDARRKRFYDVISTQPPSTVRRAFSIATVGKYRAVVRLVPFYPKNLSDIKKNSLRPTKN